MQFLLKRTNMEAPSNVGHEKLLSVQKWALMSISCKIEQEKEGTSIMYW